MDPVLLIIDVIRESLWLLLVGALLLPYLTRLQLARYFWLGTAAVIIAAGLLVFGFAIPDSALLKAELATVPILFALPLLCLQGRHPDGLAAELASTTRLSAAATFLILLAPMTLWLAAVLDTLRRLLASGIPEIGVPSCFRLLGIGALLLALIGALWLRRRLPELLTFPGLILAVAAGRLLAHRELILPLQSLVTRMMHDITHWLDILLLVPHHHLVSQRTWDIFAFVMNRKVNLSMLFTVLFLILVFSVVSHFRRPLPSIPAGGTRVQRRQARAGSIGRRRRQALPFVVAAAMLALAANLAPGLYLDVYQPHPDPVPVDNGIVRLPLRTPRRDLGDGRLRKFTARCGETTVTFLVIVKPGGPVVATIDDCLLCPPRGYGQRGKDLFCLYCQTIIPIDTVGREGGCNPVPLFTRSEGAYLVVSAAELLRGYHEGEQMTSGEADSDGSE